MTTVDYVLTLFRFVQGNIHYRNKKGAILMIYRQRRIRGLLQEILGKTIAVGA